MRYQLLLIVVIFLTACNSKVKQANKRGLEYMKQNLYEQAITEFDNALSINNTWFPVYYNRAISYANTRRYKEALADFNYVIANYPDHTDACCLLRQNIRDRNDRRHTLRQKFHYRWP